MRFNKNANPYLTKSVFAKGQERDFANTDLKSLKLPKYGFANPYFASPDLLQIRICEADSKNANLAKFGFANTDLAKSVFGRRVRTAPSTR